MLRHAVNPSLGAPLLSGYGRHPCLRGSDPPHLSLALGRCGDMEAFGGAPMDGFTASFISRYLPLARRKRQAVKTSINITKTKKATEVTFNL